MIDQQKNKIRKHIKVKKQEYTFDVKKKKSKDIFDQIRKMPEFKNARTVLAYWSMSDEVHTHDFILEYYPEKRFILPVVKGDILELREFTGINNMKKGTSFGIEEPMGEVFQEIEKIDFMIIPGVAFDKENNRLGRGKAYYDKLLKNAKALKIGVCFDFQMADSVPVDQFDIKMDKVIYNV